MKQLPRCGDFFLTRIQSNDVIYNGLSTRTKKPDARLRCIRLQSHGQLRVLYPEVSGHLRLSQLPSLPCGTMSDTRAGSSCKDAAKELANCMNTHSKCLQDGGALKHCLKDDLPDECQVRAARCCEIDAVNIHDSGHVQRVF